MNFLNANSIEEVLTALDFFAPAEYSKDGRS